MQGSPLPADAPAFYQRNGYFLPQNPVFRPDQFARLAALFEELLANRGDKRSDELDVPHFTEPRLMEFLTADEVLDIVEPFIGPNIGLWSSHFISKEPRTGRATPWHTDADYWEGRFDRSDGIVTVWLAMDPVDRENGCMKVIPGTHHGADHTYTDVDRATNTFPVTITPDQVDDAKAVYFELAPNHCSLHDARIIHGADANTSPRRRTGYTMRYFDLSMRMNREDPANQGHKIWLCRGKNLGDNPVENAGP
jgi:ectoine hydroxylase-related dioxygenase (phytanoyl-CoA dioxygenase family)